MKKIKIMFFNLITLLLTNNCVYASEGSVSNTQSNSSYKIILVIFGIILIGIVLFVSYKSDKKEEKDNKFKNKTRKIKKHENSLDEDVYSSIYEHITNDEIEENEQVEDEEKSHELIDESNLIPRDEEHDESYSEEEEKNEMPLNLDENEAFEMTFNDDIEGVIKNNNETNEKNLKENQEETVQYDDYVSANEGIKKMLKVFGKNDIDYQVEKENINKNISNGYNYGENDFSDIESEIKHAGIRRFTRVKPEYQKIRQQREAEEALRKEEETKKQEKPKARKVYTRVKPKVEEKIEEPVKRKRGRPRKGEEKPKPKRGRPRKDEKRPKKRTTKKAVTKKKTEV